MKWMKKIVLFFQEIDWNLVFLVVLVGFACASGALSIYHSEHYSRSLIFFCLLGLHLLSTLKGKIDSYRNDIFELQQRCAAYARINKEVMESLSKIEKLNPAKITEDDHQRVVKDRDYLLLFMARSYKMADKLLIEKKHPDANKVTLVYQLKNGNLRFSINEELVPDFLWPGTTLINTEKINYKNNYRLIDELIAEMEEK